jgi:hypothetical protein
MSPPPMKRATVVASSAAVTLKWRGMPAGCGAGRKDADEDHTAGICILDPAPGGMGGMGM